MEMEEQEKEATPRVNIRMSRSQYDLMMRLAGSLGIERPGQAAKHFFVLGLQSSMGSLSAHQSGEMLARFQAFMELIQDESTGG